MNQVCPTELVAVSVLTIYTNLPPAPSPCTTHTPSPRPPDRALTGEALNLEREAKAKGQMLKAKIGLKSFPPKRFILGVAVGHLKRRRRGGQLQKYLLLIPNHLQQIGKIFCLPIRPIPLARYR
jgi:hypothetical protein